MTLDSLLAIIGLGVAAYQLMPRARQLDLWVRLHVFDIAVIAGGTLTIGYLQFYPVFAALGLTPHLGLRRWELTPERVSFFVFLLVFSIVAIHFRSSRLPRRSLPRLRELVEELLWNDTSQAASVIEHHLPRIRQFAKSETAWERVRRWAVPTQQEQLLEIARLPDLSEAGESPQAVRSHLRILQRSVRRVLLPVQARFAEQRPGAEDASRLLSRVQRSREFARAVAARRPYLGIALMSEADHDTYEFMRFYFEALLDDPASVLHREVRDNDRGGGRVSVVPETDRLLFFLFKDPHVSERLQVYQPIGDAALAKLMELSRNPASDEYNLSADQVFREGGCWSTFLYPVVAFFDLMVTSSLYGGVRWHMWLLYYAEFTDRMIENHSPRGGITESDSFYQTRYTYLMYQMMSRNRDWILAVHAVRDQPYIADVDVNFEYDNENIPKIAIICLIRMLSSILIAMSLPVAFRHRIAHMVFETYFKLRKCGGCERYAEILLIGIRRGYDSYDHNRRAAYQNELRAAYASFDTIPHMMNGMRRGATIDPLADFRRALNL